VVRNGICGAPIDDGEMIFYEQLGDEYDGFMDTPTMLNHVQMRVSERLHNAARAIATDPTAIGREQER
jgi:hypothetical protein